MQPSACVSDVLCTPSELRVGAVWQCERCRQVWGCPAPKDGVPAWIRISDEDPPGPARLRFERHDEDELRA